MAFLVHVGYRKKWEDLVGGHTLEIVANAAYLGNILANGLTGGHVETDKVLMLRGLLVIELGLRYSRKSCSILNPLVMCIGTRRR